MLMEMEGQFQEENGQAAEGQGENITQFSVLSNDLVNGYIYENRGGEKS